MEKKLRQKETTTVSNAADMGGSSYHIPVMLKESIEALQIRPDGVYVDCTFGGGGHSRAILQQLGPKGKLIAFDQDADAATNVPADPRLLFVPENFRYMHRFLRLHGALPVDGVLADLGVSSHQFDEASRGFSFRFDAELDMRMDRRQHRTAATILNEYSAEELQRIFSMYGEVTNARTLAAAIVQERSKHPFHSIQDLLSVLTSMAKGNPNRYYAQVFQAIRIEVNEELTVLKEWLEQLPQVLKPGGRVAVITFHSLEDRMVKIFLRDGTFQREADPIYGHSHKSPFELLSKKPIVASAQEVRMNERSRSARLRVAKYTSGEK